MIVRLAGIALLVAGSFLFLTMEASARWTCRAHSPTGSWGYGYHNNSESYARRRALYECAKRTPRGYVCRLRECVKSNRY